MMRHLYGAFMRGFLFALPIGVTIFIVSFIWSLAEQWLGPIVAFVVRLLLPDAWLVGPLQGGHIPGLSLVLLLAIIIFLGWLAAWPIGERGLRLIDHVFRVIPGVRSIYSTVRKMAEILGRKKSFQRVVWVPFPSDNCRSLGFVTASVLDETSGTAWVAVFVPTVPNVTSGFTIWYRESQTVPANIPASAALEIVVSLGTLSPAQMSITGSAATAGSPPPEMPAE